MLWGCLDMHNINADFSDSAVSTCRYLLSLCSAQGLWPCCFTDLCTASKREKEKSKKLLNNISHLTTLLELYIIIISKLPVNRGLFMCPGWFLNREDWNEECCWLQQEVVNTCKSHCGSPERQSSSMIFKSFYSVFILRVF